MKILSGALIVLALAGCVSSSRPASPAPAATIVVPSNTHTTIICSDGSAPPCN